MALPWVFSKFSHLDLFGSKVFESLPGFFTDILSWVIGLLLIYVAYKVIHYLMQFKIFDAIVAYTSFTKYQFWRRYKPEKEKTSV
jgi:hypothetical protein